MTSKKLMNKICACHALLLVSLSNTPSTVFNIQQALKRESKHEIDDYKTTSTIQKRETY